MVVIDTSVWEIDIEMSVVEVRFWDVRFRSSVLGGEI